MRRNFTCAASGSSPISSRKIVPPSASSKYPLRCSEAPVNEPRLMPEQLALDDPFGIAPQFTVISGFLVPVTCGMDGLGDHFFARPALPGDKNGDVGGRHLFDDLDDLPHLDGFAEDAVLFLKCSCDRSSPLSSASSVTMTIGIDTLLLLDSAAAVLASSAVA